jgi:hypothetical protein
MADPRLILGRIVSVEGTTPGPASGITYTIAVHDPQVEGIFRLERQKPVQRWPDALDIVALRPGQLVIGAVAANAVQWHFHEYPAFRDCATPANLQSIEPGDGIRTVRPPGSGEGEVGPGDSEPIVNPD